MRTGMEWDKWYYELCTVVGKKSQCLSRKIGAILVKDKAVVSQGYNGPPRGVRTCDKRWYVDKQMCEKAGLEELQFIHEVELDKKVEGKCPRYIPEMGFKSGEYGGKNIGSNFPHCKRFPLCHDALSTINKLRSRSKLKSLLASSRNV